MILSGNAIRERLNDGEIFEEGTWDKRPTNEGAIKEASYALRVAPDGLMLEGKHYRPGEECIQGDIEIKPGKVAILSTVERLNMPGNLVGKIGIRFKYACQGLTGLMGIQVDPLYGRGRDNERLYIRVANLGNYPILIPLCAEVFTFELHQVLGEVHELSTPRVSMWHRIQETLIEQREPSWSYVTQVQVEVDNVEKRLESGIKGINDYLQPLVMFGIFLIAVTILSVALSVILSVRDAPTVTVPTWVTDWGWQVLLGTLSFAAVMTALMGGVIVASVACRSWKGR